MGLHDYFAESTRILDLCQEIERRLSVPDFDRRRTVIVSA
jgi:hypothetical protein